MVIRLICLAIFTMASLFYSPISQAKALSDGQVKKLIIQESIESYSGRCPCPYNVTRNGRSCGGRSAYNRPGGYAPLCYPQDVTPAMVKEYRQQH